MCAISMCQSGSTRSRLPSCKAACTMKEGRPAIVADYEKYERDKDKEIKRDPNKPTEIPKILDPIQKSGGLGGAKFFADLMTARWTIDALAHQVSVQNLKARDKLAARMTVKEYETVLDKKSDREIADAYQARVRKDLLILALFSFLFLGATMIALKQKDSL